MKDILRFILEADSVTIVGIALVIIIIYAFIKVAIMKTKGKNSKEKNKIQQLLKQNIVEFERYIPVYAYFREDIGMHSVRCYHYGVGILENKMYVLPLVLVENDILANKTWVIEKDNVGEVKYNKIVNEQYKVAFYDKNGKMIFEMIVDGINVKQDKSYPFIINQVQEVNDFIDCLEKWKR